MKKVLSVLLASLLIGAILVTSVAAKTFVPSIGYKPAPNIDDDRNGRIIVTSVGEAATTTRIPRLIADHLISTYNEFADSEFRLSSVSDELNTLVSQQIGPDYDADVLVIRDFFNIEALDDEIDEYLAVDGQTMTITFDVDLEGKPVYVMVYVPGFHDGVDEAAATSANGIVPMSRNLVRETATDLSVRDWENGEWELVEAVDNGDGTMSVTFEDFGHVAIMVPTVDSEITPPTGDASVDNGFWVALMIGASLLIVALVGAHLRLSKRERV